MDQIGLKENFDKSLQNVQVQSMEEILSISSDDSQSLRSVYKMDYKEEVVDEELIPKQKKTVAITLEDVKPFKCNQNEEVQLQVGKKEFDGLVSYLQIDEKIYESEYSTAYGKIKKSEELEKPVTPRDENLSLQNISIVLNDENSSKHKLESKQVPMVDESVISFPMDDVKRSVKTKIVKQVKKNVGCILNSISFELMDTIAKTAAFLFIFWIVWKIFSVSADLTKKVTSGRSHTH